MNINFCKDKEIKFKKGVDIKNWCNIIRIVGEETAGADIVPEGAEGITEVPNFRRYNLRKYEVFECQHELKPEILNFDK